MNEYMRIAKELSDDNLITNVGGPFGALIGGGIGYLLGFGKMVDGAVGLAGAAANKALNDEKCLMNMDADQIGKCVDAAVAAEQWKEYRGKK